MFSGILLAYILNGRLDPGVLISWRASETLGSVCPVWYTGIQLLDCGVTV